MVISQINNISDIILEVLKIIEDCIIFKGNNNGNKNWPKIDSKMNGHSNSVLPNIPQPNLGIYIPYSCNPRIQSYEDISFEKTGKK